MENLEREKEKMNNIRPVNNDFEDEKNRYQGKLKLLEQENDNLIRENNKLRSEKSVTVYTMSNQGDDGPYSINPR